MKKLTFIFVLFCIAMTACNNYKNCYTNVVVTGDPKAIPGEPFAKWFLVPVDLNNDGGTDDSVRITPEKVGYYLWLHQVKPEWKVVMSLVVKEDTDGRTVLVHQSGMYWKE